MSRLLACRFLGDEVPLLLTSAVLRLNGHTHWLNVTEDLLGFMFSPANSMKGFTGLYLSPAFSVETPRRPAP